MKRIIMLTVFVIAVSSVLIAQTTNQAETVVMNFMDKLKAQDLNGMMNCYAISDYVQNYDFKSVSSYIKGINLQAQLLPSNYSLYKEINAYTRSMKVVSQIEVLILTLIGGNDIVKYITTTDPQQVTKFITEIDPSPIKTIKLIDIRYPVAKKDNDRMLDLYSRQSKVDGAMDATERVALIEFDGKTYVLPFKLYKYGTSWEIYELTSVYAGLFGVTALSIEEYNTRYPKW